MAAMGGGMNNWMNNPFVYLVWMMFANRMWGGEQNCNPAIQAQIDSLRNQIADNQNSNLLMDAVHGNTAAITQLAGNLNCDFNALNGAICDVRGGVDRLSGQVGFSAERVINSVSQGNLQMIQALKAGNIVLSTSSEALIKEVNAICNDAKEKLANRDYYQMVVDKTPELLVALNPALKKEQETETRLKAVEGSVQEVKDLVKTLVEKLS